MSKRKDMRTRPAPVEKNGASTQRLVVVGALILVVLGGIAAITMTNPSEPIAAPDPEFQPVDMQYDPVLDRHWHAGHGHWHDGPPPAQASFSATGGDGVPAPPHITDPKPWQYDEITNSHFDPGHGHWHAGRPPAGVDEFVLSSPVRSDMVPAPSGIINPQPWQYDEATDKHYHPGHAHWHAGPPPPVEQR